MDINTLAKGQGGVNVKAVLKNCANMRSIHRSVNRGFSVKKTKRYLADIPFEVQYLKYWTCPSCEGRLCDKCRTNPIPGKVPNPYIGRYFDRNMDRHEKKKGLYAFLRKNPEYMCVDRL